MTEPALSASASLLLPPGRQRDAYGRCAVVGVTDALGGEALAAAPLNVTDDFNSASAVRPAGSTPSTSVSRLCWLTLRRRA